MSLSSGWPATSAIARGSSASTMVPSPASRTTTLHGSGRPMVRSADSARCASGGLQAPRMTYCSISSPSFSRSVDCTSISVSTPKPWALSAARICSFASANEAVVRRVIAYSTAIPFPCCCRGPFRDGTPGPLSGQAQEQLLHLLLGHPGLVAGGQALPHPARHDLESGPVQRPGHRGQLRHDVLSVTSGLDHPHHPRQ